MVSFWHGMTYVFCGFLFTTEIEKTSIFFSEANAVCQEAALSLIKYPERILSFPGLLFCLYLFMCLNANSIFDLLICRY